MLDHRILVILAILFVLVYKIVFSDTEHFGGALYQLYAKGPQDVYLTTNVEQYIPEYGNPYYPYNFYNPPFWNAPTRFRNNFPYYIPIEHRLREDYWLLPY